MGGHFLKIMKDANVTLFWPLCIVYVKLNVPRHSVQVYTTNILYIFTWKSFVCLVFRVFFSLKANNTLSQNKTKIVVKDCSVKSKNLSCSSVLSSPKARGVVRCPFSVHSDAWLPVSHSLSDTKTSERARSVITTVQTHPLPVTQTALKGRGRWHSMYSTADFRQLSSATWGVIKYNNSVAQ